MKRAALLLLALSVSTPSLAAPPKRVAQAQGQGQGQGKAKKAKPKKKEAAPVDEAPSATGDPRGSTAKPSDPAPLDAQRTPEEASSSRGPSRIEFDERLIQGQTNKANAIYLFERRESALRSLLKKRTDFHEEIDEALE